MWKRNRPLFCSFCRKDQHSVEKLIGGPGVYICGECVEICNRILDTDEQATLPDWESLSDEDLLTRLQPSMAAVDEVRDVLQQHVDLLRRRGTSWGVIGEALGMSRQAAWERFS